MSMRARTDALLLRRKERQLRGVQVRLDAARERIRKLADANVRLSETVTGLVRVLGALADGGDVDGDNPGHGARTARLALALGRKLGLAARETEILRMAATLHDIGRPGAGCEDGTGHEERAARMLETTALHPEVAETIRCHHDRWDGLGNRSGRSGEAIPVTARVLAVADAFDELVAGGTAAAPSEAVEALEATAGKVHDPRIVAELRNLMTTEDGLRRAGLGAPVQEEVLT